MRMTRADQDAILMPVILAAGHIDRAICQHGNWASYPTVNERMRDLRDALRLDDPVLDELIARGAHRGPWRSMPDASRVPAGVACGSIDS